MRVLLQRVSSAKVEVMGETIGEINKGVVLLTGIGPNDREIQIKYLAEKIANLRIFPDLDGNNNLSLLDVKGEALVISQFTLYANITKGRRPTYTGAAAPDIAMPLIDKFSTMMQKLGVPTYNGKFGAHMEVSLTNDGPITIWLEKE